MEDSKTQYSNFGTSGKEPKEYIVITGIWGRKSLEKKVNQKLAEGWRLHGTLSYGWAQAMVR